MNITVLGVPPTQLEINTAKKHHLIFAVYLYAIIRLVCLFSFGLFVNLVLTPVASFWMFWLCASIALGLTVTMLRLDTKLRERGIFAPITKQKCAKLVPSLDQPEVAEYCRQVATQGRLLVEAEYEVMIQYHEYKQRQALDAKTDTDCKKVYGLIA